MDEEVEGADDEEGGGKTFELLWRGHRWGVIIAIAVTPPYNRINRISSRIWSYIIYLIFSETISRLEQHEWFLTYPVYPLPHRG